MEAEGKRTTVCNGLLADWSNWIRSRGEAASQMQQVLDRLTPRGERLEAGPPVRISVDDVRDIPTIRTPNSGAVPVLHASAAQRRVMGLAYILRWSWTEHLRAVQLLGEAPTQQLVLLIDELESHLHPRWQGSLLSSLLHVAEPWNAEVQLLATTHSPLILASAEPFFDKRRDAWFDLDSKGAKVKVRRRQLSHAPPNPPAHRP